jgi:hypothetical protein
MLSKHGPFNGRATASQQADDANAAGCTSDAHLVPTAQGALKGSVDGSGINCNQPLLIG